MYDFCKRSFQNMWCVNYKRKFIDRKKTKLFRFRWNWVEEKTLRGIRRQISSPTPQEGVVILQILLLLLKGKVSRDSIFIKFCEVTSMHSFVSCCFALKGQCHKIFYFRYHTFGDLPHVGQFADLRTQYFCNLRICDLLTQIYCRPNISANLKILYFSAYKFIPKLF